MVDDLKTVKIEGETVVSAPIGQKLFLVYEQKNVFGNVSPVIRAFEEVPHESGVEKIVEALQKSKQQKEEDKAKEALVVA